MADDAPIFDAGETCAFPDCENPRPVSTGRGRPPKYCEVHRGKSSAPSSSNTRKASTDAKRAAESLNDAYTGIVYALMLAQLPRAASDLTASLDTLKERNERHLSSNPALCKRINSLSSKGGTAGLFIANAMVLVPVTLTAMQEVAEKRAERADAESENENVSEGPGFYPGTSIPIDPEITGL